MHPTKGSRSDGRHMIHKNRFEEFRKWLIKNTAYYEVPTNPNQGYEVARFVKYDPSGDHPPLILYKRLKSDHLTIPWDMWTDVKAFFDDVGPRPRSNKRRINHNHQVSGKP